MFKYPGNWKGLLYHLSLYSLVVRTRSIVTIQHSTSNISFELDSNSLYLEDPSFPSSISYIYTFTALVDVSTEKVARATMINWLSEAFQGIFVILKAVTYSTYKITIFGQTTEYILLQQPTTFLW